MTEGVSQHRDAAKRTGKRTGKRPPRGRSEPVEVTQVDPAVWQMALKLADRDADRLRVIDSQTVVVENQPRHARN
jgi:hypothetical protein